MAPQVKEAFCGRDILGRAELQNLPISARAQRPNLHRSARLLSLPSKSISVGTIVVPAVGTLHHFCPVDTKKSFRASSDVGAAKISDLFPNALPP